MKRDYYDIPKIDICSILTKPQNIWAVTVLKKLGIEIGDKIYTEYEFDCLRVDVAEYYDKEYNLPNDITKEDYTKLRELFDNIDN